MATILASIVRDSTVSLFLLLLLLLLLFRFLDILYALILYS